MAPEALKYKQRLQQKYRITKRNITVMKKQVFPANALLGGGQTVFSTCNLVVVSVMDLSLFRMALTDVPNTYLVVRRHQPHKKQEPPPIRDGS